MKTFASLSEKPRLSVSRLTSGSENQTTTPRTVAKKTPQNAYKGRKLTGESESSQTPRKLALATQAPRLRLDDRSDYIKREACYARSREDGADTLALLASFSASGRPRTKKIETLGRRGKS